MKTKTPNCPKCKRPTVVAGALFRCPKCGGFYDDNPDEGGDFSDRNPAARLEREERRREARAVKRY